MLAISVSRNLGRGVKVAVPALAVLATTSRPKVESSILPRIVTRVLDVYLCCHRRCDRSLNFPYIERDCSDAGPELGHEFLVAFVPPGGGFHLYGLDTRCRW